MCNCGKDNNALASKRLICSLDTRKRVVIQDGLYSRFAEHVKTICLEFPRWFQTVASNMRMITDKIVNPPTRVVLCSAVDQGFYDPITKLRVQLGLREWTKKMLTGMRTVFIPASWRLFTSS
jgi:hypothetical protein